MTCLHPKYIYLLHCCHLTLTLMMMSSVVVALNAHIHTVLVQVLS